MIGMVSSHFTIQDVQMISVLLAYHFFRNRRNRRKRVNIQFKGHLVSSGYSERVYELCGSEFF